MNLEPLNDQVAILIAGTPKEADYAQYYQLIRDSYYIDESFEPPTDLVATVFINRCDGYTASEASVITRIAELSAKHYSQELPGVKVKSVVNVEGGYTLGFAYVNGKIDKMVTKFGDEL